MSDRGCFLWNTTLGWYDYQTFTVVLAHHDDPDAILLTSVHERLHHQLTTYSSYGLLLQTMASESRGSARERAVLKELVEQCRTVQEMTATYGSLAGDSQGLAIVAKMPEFYRSAYARAAAMADRYLGSTLFNRAFIFNIARCAMMTAFHESVPQLADRLAEDGELPPLSRPDRRLEIIEHRLGELPADAVRAELKKWDMEYVDAPDIASLVESLGSDDVEIANWASNVNRTMMEVLCTFLEQDLPGLEDSASLMRMYAAGASLNASIDPVSTTREGLNYIRESADQTVAFHVGPLPRTDVFSRNKRALDRIVKQSVAKTGALRYFVECAREDSEPACYVTDMDWWRGRPNLQCYRLDKTEVDRLWSRDSSVTIIEAQDMANLLCRQVPEHVRTVLRRDCFVHIADNPVRFLEEIIQSGVRAEWTVGLVSYRNEAVTVEQGLQIVLYSVEGRDHTYFHLSNTSLTDALGQFTNSVVGDDRKIAYVPGEEYVRRFSENSFVQLIDHPILGSFYVCGRVARLP